MIDLTNKGIRCLLYALLDEISETARATNRGRMSARLLGRRSPCASAYPYGNANGLPKLGNGNASRWEAERRPGPLVKQQPHCTEQAEMQEAARELSRAALGMNCRAVPSGSIHHLKN